MCVPAFFIPIEKVDPIFGTVDLHLCAGLLCLQVEYEIISQRLNGIFLLRHLPVNVMIG